MALPLALQLQRHAEAEERTRIAQDAANATQLTLKPLTEPDAPETGDIAIGGQTGAKARDLLDTAAKSGQRLLAGVMRSALTRTLKDGRGLLVLRGMRTLFTPEEREALSTGLASILAPANLLGRSRIRRRVEDTAESFADAPLRPMAPAKAVAYFQSLTPGMKVDSQAFEAEQRRQAFTLAVSTEKALLDRVKGLIAQSLERGDSTTSTAKQVQDLLDKAGVSPRNPQYAEMVVRTNIADALNTGQTEEMQDPDVADFFPVWQYQGIDDARASLDHRQHFDKYYPNTATFAQVRGKRVWNCRCGQRAIDAIEWEELQAKGARIEPGYAPVAAAPPKPAKKPKSGVKGLTPERDPLTLTRADLDQMKRGELIAAGKAVGIDGAGGFKSDVLRERIEAEIVADAQRKQAAAKPTPEPQKQPVQAAKQPEPTKATTDPRAAVAAAFQRLDKGANQVAIADIADATGLDVPTLHQAINDLRRQGILTGSQAERQIDDRTAATSIREGDSRIIHVAVRTGKGDDLAAVAGIPTPTPVEPKPVKPTPPAPMVPSPTIDLPTRDVPARSQQTTPSTRPIEQPEKEKVKTKPTKADPAPVAPVVEKPKTVEPEAPKPMLPTKRFATIAEAEEHFDMTYNASIKKGRATTDKEFLEHAAHVGDETERMKAEYKAVADTLKRRSIRNQSLELGTEFSGAEKNTAGKYSYGNGIEMGQLPVDPDAVPMIGVHTVGTDLGTCYRHEFGHEIYNVTFNGAKQKDWNKRFQKYVGTRTVSRYGGTNTSELFSESFAAYTSPNYKRGMLPPDIEEWLDKNVKGGKK